MLVRIGAVAVAALASMQWWQLADRASHIILMHWKFGDFPVTTSVLGLSFFVACSPAGASVGVAVSLSAALPARIRR